jgi:hypothetical protein
MHRLLGQATLGAYFSACPPWGGAALLRSLADNYVFRFGFFVYELFARPQNAHTLCVLNLAKTLN